MKLMTQSRSFFLGIEAATTALVPYFDMVNHASEPHCNIEIKYCSERNGLIIEAIKELKQN
jgi:hypothetical protein